MRLLGVLAPFAVPYWLGAERVVALTLGTTRHLGPAVETIAAPRLVKGDASSRVRHGLTVYDGGRE